ncbi:ATP-binding protein [Hymenobacter terrenus]|uniref:ATP-binding protein n=1 Tax=Hymenobacter terrenus TaxID=1629124 RepID=UPI00069837A4|nr:DUF87 domain-containing protein [Hymenobacter terrenus]
MLLLRVLEPVSLPQDNDLVRTRLEHHQRRRAEDMFPGAINDGLDPMTHAELQYGGMKCRILGTFFLQDGKLRLGSDIENFMTLSRLRAYKPTREALATIVNHINPEVLQKSKEEALKSGFKGMPSPIELGTVRYTSTDRMHRRLPADLVTVQIQPTDFLARRTAVLGMTRTGKSNTVKTTVSAVALAAMQDGIKVGQLIFDINGEYANANHQDDDSSIAKVFDKLTVRYLALETPGFEDLRTNFYQESQQGLGLIQSLFRSDKQPYSGQDLEAFLESTLEEPDDTAVSEHTRWKRHRAVFQCLLFRAGYPVPTGFRVEVPTATALVKQVNAWGAAQTPPVTPVVPVQAMVPVDEAVDWFELLRRVNLSLKKIQKAANQTVVGIKSSTPGNSWVDAMLEAYLNMLARESSRELPVGGWRAIQKYIPYHSPRRSADVTEEILAHIDAGKIVILDLSAGPVEIRKVLSKRIAARIFDRQMGIMNEGKMPQNLVIYVEEAHNLIGKGADLTDTWPRLAKEGAKAKIAFVYATQEPSSVHPNILANTENWFVTYLNNDDELKTLAKFYDFKDFIGSLKAAQDVGFARIKTLSSPFVIPTQIRRFTPEDITQRIAAIEAKRAEAK